MKTKSRRHTGIQVSREFQVGIDDEASGFTDLFTGLKMARGYMDWMVARVSTYSLTAERRCDLHEKGTSTNIYIQGRDYYSRDGEEKGPIQALLD